MKSVHELYLSNRDKEIVDNTPCARSYCNNDGRRLIWARDYTHARVRNGSVMTVESIRLVRERPNTTITASLKLFLDSIPISPQILFDIYDTVLPESIAYHKGVIEQNKRNKKHKTDAFEGKIFDLLSYAPWLNNLADSDYFNTLLAPLRKGTSEHWFLTFVTWIPGILFYHFSTTISDDWNAIYQFNLTFTVFNLYLLAPSKATKKAIKAVVDDIRHKYDALSECFKMDFLITSNKIENNQGSSSSASDSSASASSASASSASAITTSSSASASTSGTSSTASEEPDIEIDDSFEISLKAYFNQTNPNNRIFKHILGSELELISKGFFHSAMVKVINVQYMFISDITEEKYKKLALAL
jgi:hypothetical protein